MLIMVEVDVNKGGAVCFPILQERASDVFEPNSKIILIFLEYGIIICVE
jgi:hypothetical protein